VRCATKQPPGAIYGSLVTHWPPGVFRAPRRSTDAPTPSLLEAHKKRAGRRRLCCASALGGTNLWKALACGRNPRTITGSCSHTRSSCAEPR
jgi:hypothetical protein